MWHRNTGILRPDSAHRGDIVTDCMVDLLAEGGFSAVTLRTLAARVGVTSSALIRWFGSTDQMWEVIAARYGQRRERIRASKRLPLHDRVSAGTQSRRPQRAAKSGKTRVCRDLPLRTET